MRGNRSEKFWGTCLYFLSIRGSTEAKIIGVLYHLTAGKQAGFARSLLEVAHPLDAGPWAIGPRRLRRFGSEKLRRAECSMISSQTALKRRERRGPWRSQ